MNDGNIRDHDQAAAQPGHPPAEAQGSKPDASTVESNAPQLQVSSKSTSLSRIAKGFWDKFTPEQRSQIMRDRSAKRYGKKAIRAPKTKKAKKPARSLSQIQASAALKAREQCWRWDLSRLATEAKELRRSHLSAADALEKLITFLS